MTAVFTLDTLTYEKTYNVTVKKQAADANEDIFLSECSAVTEDSYLGPNDDKDNIKFDLNLPISPLPSGVEIAWTSSNSDVIGTDGTVKRGSEDETVELTAAISMKSGDTVLFSDSKTLTYTVKAADGETLWKLSDSIKFDNADGTLNYYFGSYSTDKGEITLEKNGAKISQTSSEGFADDTERPSVNIDLSNHIESGKTYYVRFSYTAYMRSGSTRIYMNNSDGGEAALLELKSSNGSVISAAAKTSSGNREWIDSKLGMKHYQNTEESLGLIYDTSSDSFQFVQNDAVVNETYCSNSYGSGLSGIKLSFQGGNNGEGSYVILRGVDVYEYDSALMEAVAEAAEEITAELITDQDAELVYKDLNSLPLTGMNDTNITWSSSDESVISNTGKVTRKAEDQNVTLKAVIERSGCTIEKEFEFVVIGTDNNAAELEIDKKRIIKAAEGLGLSAEQTVNITDNIDMSALITESEFGNTIAYTTSDDSVLKNDGTVVRDPEEDKEVSIICTVNGDEQIEFKLIVKASGNDIEGNLAKGASASSASRFAADCGPENAVDERYTTKWFTSGNPGEPYITVDLGTEQLVASVILYEAEGESGYNVKKAKIETSTDGRTYTTAAELSGVGEECTAVFAPVKARYVRYTVTEKNTGDTGLYEFVIKYAPRDADVVAADKTAFTWPYDYVVTDDLELPETGEYGSKITWKSSDTSLITDDGKVTRPQRENSSGNKVTLTATFTSGDASDTLQILCKVKALSDSGSGSGGSSGGSGGGSGSGSGGGNASGGATAGIYNPSPTSAPEEEDIFSDVSKDRWSYDYIKTLYDKGVVSGDGGRFYPEREITREELVKLVVEAFGVEIESGDTGFEDVASGAWYEQYVYTAKKNGIINGISEDRFGVGLPVTRQDMAAVIYRAASAAGAVLEGSGKIDVFTDRDSISDYAYEAVDAMASAGIINGMEDGSFAPFESASREQCTKVICLSIENL